MKIIEAYDLPLAYCNYVFCQYEFWDHPNVVELSSPGSKSNSVVFSEEQVKTITLKARTPVALSQQVFVWMGGGGGTDSLWNNCFSEY